jgi:sialic acid synthase SpsE
MTVNNDTTFIAEVSSNHNGNLNRCFNFIETAASIGCDGVKFQLFEIEKLFAPIILQKSKKHLERKTWNLPFRFIPEIAKKCHQIGIEFSCTPFYLGAVNIIDPYVDVIKISSYDILRHDLLAKCAKTKKPIVMATGMATLKEVDQAMSILKQSGASNITLLHCLSVYPAPVDETNLKVIKMMRNRYKCPVGWSDHSVNANVVYRAVQGWGASMIEFHLDIDSHGVEYLPKGYNWLPEEIEPIISNIKAGKMVKINNPSIDGDGIKTPTQSEIKTSEVLWRADPSDGLRPLLEMREEWYKK